MVRPLRRTVLLALVALLLGALALRGRRAAPATAVPEAAAGDELRWPPIEPADRTATPAPAPAPAPAELDPQVAADVAEVPVDAAALAEARPWVHGTPGSCPDGFPVKVNVRSGIFHVPGGRFYDRTVADRWYATAGDAVADGYRAAKA